MVYQKIGKPEVLKPRNVPDWLIVLCWYLANRSLPVFLSEVYRIFGNNLDDVLNVFSDDLVSARFLSTEQIFSTEREFYTEREHRCSMYNRGTIF